MLKQEFGNILSRAFKFFAGTGIGKIPGVTRIFSYLVSICGGKFFVEVDRQKLYYNVRYSKGLIYSYSSSEIRRYEPHVTSLFCSMVKDGMAVVDIGASIGYYTLLAAKRVGDNGLVFAFEPEPSEFERLEENIKINGWNNVRAFQLAVSDVDGKRRFEILPSGFARRTEAVDGTTINTVSLDSFLKTDPDIVKMDIEGGELEALKGMEKILAKGKVKIICEVHPTEFSSLGYNTREIVDLLKQYDYNSYLISDKGLIPANSLDNERAHYLFAKEKMK